jgi:hypothetical protein
MSAMSATSAMGDVPALDEPLRDCVCSRSFLDFLHLI